MDAKQMLSDILGFYKHKIDTDGCTPEEIADAQRILTENLHIYATIDELSEHFGKSKDAVSSVIKRRMVQKPRRNVVLYPFHEFLKIVPDSWRKNR